MDNNNVYKKYSNFLSDKYGTKVYKLPVNINVSCPNRDGNLDGRGCFFCSEDGAGHENLSNELSIKEQLEINMSYISKKYKAKKFIAYFQNFTNTYLPLELFKLHIESCLIPDIVEIAISTRPDCIGEEYLQFLKDFSDKNKINITIELGLQTANYHTLININRGHTLGEFIDAVIRIKKYGFSICTHVILNLPNDSEIDVVETAKILSALKVDFVKIHSLYIAKDSVFGKMYENGEIEIIVLEEYVNRVITFLEYLSPDIVVQRLIARAPKEKTLFANWDTSWWKIHDEIVSKMKENQTCQGAKFDYLNGKRCLHES